MAVSPDLIQLLRELRNVASPRQRIRLMARGWRSLRRLSRTELQQLAGQLGINGAEELLRRLARGKGRVETRFLENVLEHVQEPDDVKGYVDALRDPEQRKALLRKGLDAVADELQPEQPEAPAPAAPTALPVSPAEPVPSPQPEPEAPAKTSKESVTRPVAVPAIPVAVVASAAAAAVETAKRASTPPTTSTRPEGVALEQAPEPPPQTDPAAPLTETSESAAPAGRPVEVKPPDRRVSAAASDPVGRLFEHVAEAPTLIERFRRLNRGIEEARRMNLEQLRALVELFPADWRRRRALSALLRERIPADLLQAMFLVEGLESTAAERWCVSTILHSWDLTDEERRTLRERHGLTPRRPRSSPAGSLEVGAG